MMKSFQKQGPSRHVQGGGIPLGMTNNRTSPLLRTLRYPGWMSDIEKFFTQATRQKREKREMWKWWGVPKARTWVLASTKTFQIECANYWTYSLGSCLDQRTFWGVQVPTTGLIPNDLPQLRTFQGGIPCQDFPQIAST